MEWISVKDKLPKRNEDVLIYRWNHIGDMMYVYTYKGNNEWEVRDGDKNIIAQGTAINPGEAMFRRVVAKLYDPAVEVYTLANGMEHVACVEMADKNCTIENFSGLTLSTNLSMVIICMV